MFNNITWHQRIITEVFCSLHCRALPCLPCLTACEWQFELRTSCDLHRDYNNFKKKIQQNGSKNIPVTFVCNGSQPVNHSSNFGWHMICTTTRVMAKNTLKTNISNRWLLARWYLALGTAWYIACKYKSNYDLCPWNQACESMCKCPMLYFETIQLFCSRRRSDGGKTSIACPGSFACDGCRHAKVDSSIRNDLFY